jgi:hypothetical protein
MASDDWPCGRSHLTCYPGLSHALPLARTIGQRGLALRLVMALLADGVRQPRRALLHHRSETALKRGCAGEPACELAAVA